MRRPGIDNPALLETFRTLWKSQGHVVVPSFVDPDVLPSLRTALAAAPWTAYELADRGRYRRNDTFSAEPLVETVRDFAAMLVEAPLTVRGALWLRFARGDYQLTHGDEKQPGLEVTVDLSAAATDQCEQVYTDGRSGFVVPQWPESLALVERRDSLYRWVRYMNYRTGQAEVFRLRLWLTRGQ
jgi:hypothetical protein